MFKKVSQGNLPSTEWHAETLGYGCRYNQGLQLIKHVPLSNLQASYKCLVLLSCRIFSSLTLPELGRDPRKPQCHVGPAGVERVLPQASQQTLSTSPHRGRQGLCTSPFQRAILTGGAVHFMPWGKQVELNNNYTFSNFNVCEQIQKDEKVPTLLDELNV